jgi:hypothetical protein
MKLSKEAFVKYINAIEQSNKLYSHYCDILSIDLVEKVSKGFQAPIPYLQDAVFTKSDLDWIDWYIYESSPGSRSVYEGSIVYHVETVEELYDFLKTFESNKISGSISDRLRSIVERSKMTTLRQET